LHELKLKRFNTSVSGLEGTVTIPFFYSIFTILKMNAKKKGPQGFYLLNKPPKFLKCILIPTNESVINTSLLVPSIHGLMIICVMGKKEHSEFSNFFGTDDDVDEDLNC
jgi:hypothetical protein